MFEPFDIKKALSLDMVSVGKSTSVVFKGLLIPLIIAVVGLGVWIVIKPHFTKPKPTTSIVGDVQNLNQDCSEQVCKALNEQAKLYKKESPWVDIRIWKILKVSLGNT